MKEATDHTGSLLTAAEMGADLGYELLPVLGALPPDPTALALVSWLRNSSGFKSGR